MKFLPEMLELQKEVLELLKKSTLFEAESEHLRQEYIQQIPTLTVARLKKAKTILLEYEEKSEALAKEQLPKLLEMRRKLMESQQKEQLEKLHQREVNSEQEDTAALAELEKQFTKI